MAVASEFSNWVKELHLYEQAADKEENQETDLPIQTSADGNPAQDSAQASLIPGKPPRGYQKPLNQLEELQQEMKLLQWHKLANEAALKAAIIKTNRTKTEDSQIAQVTIRNDKLQQTQRIQQIVEDEQLKPLNVNSAFFQEFQQKEKEKEERMEVSAERQIQQLQKLKGQLAQREEMHLRRFRFKQGLQELNSRQRSSSLPPKDAKEKSVDKNKENDPALYRSASMREAMDPKTVISSLDRLMELEKRIRQLESTDFTERAPSTAKDTVRFDKRKTIGAHQRPSQTVYSVSKVRSKAPATNNRRVPAPRTRGPNGTFLTSVPESKQKQLRRMTEREKRLYLKKEKAKQEEMEKQKQDLVVKNWMAKKRQAAVQRRTNAMNTPSGVKRANAARPTGASRVGTSTGPAASTNTRRNVTKPMVRAPAVGAASGRKIPHSNIGMQKFDTMKKEFGRRTEAVRRAPTTVNMRAGFGQNTQRRPSNRAPRGPAPVHGRGLSNGRTLGGGRDNTTAPSRAGVSKPPVQARAALSVGASQMSMQIGNRGTKLPAIYKKAESVATRGKSVPRSGDYHTNHLPVIPQRTDSFNRPGSTFMSAKAPGKSTGPQFSRLFKR